MGELQGTIEYPTLRSVLFAGFFLYHPMYDQTQGSHDVFHLLYS